MRPTLSTVATVIVIAVGLVAGSPALKGRVTAPPELCGIIDIACEPWLPVKTCCEGLVCTKVIAADGITVMGVRNT